MFAWLRSWQALIAVATLFAMSVPLSSRVSAQNLFDWLFGNRPLAEPQVNAPPPPAAKIVVTPRSNAGGTKKAATLSKPLAQSHFCVRLCDGRYFPAQFSPEQAASEYCSAVCPAARTQVYSGPEIDSAFSAEGRRYGDLRAAFSYRQQISPNCSCQKKSVFGLAPIDVRSDMTLRRNDLVVLKEGLRVFTGFRKVGKKQEAMFVPIEKSSAAASLRRELRMVRVSSRR